jgi:hypothetical protein
MKTPLGALARVGILIVRALISLLAEVVPGEGGAWGEDDSAGVEGLAAYYSSRFWEPKFPSSEKVTGVLNRLGSATPADVM